MTPARVQVLDSELAYVESGTGPLTIVLLHGNPTSSYLWRHVQPQLAGLGRCLALDLIGMGGSGKPDLAYTFADHAAHLTAFLDAVVPDDEVVLVGHDWGAVLALDHAARRPDRVSGLVLCEGHLVPIESWDDTDDGFRDLFGRLRTPGLGEQIVMRDNFFLEQVLPSGMAHRLSDEELAAYLAPYPREEDRLPIWQWVQQIPIDGEPADVDAVVRANQACLASGRAPTLLLHGEPGAVVGAAQLDWVHRYAPTVTVRSVGPGTHFLPEDQPDAIAAEIVAWLPTFAG